MKNDEIKNYYEIKNNLNKMKLNKSNYSSNHELSYKMNQLKHDLNL